MFCKEVLVHSDLDLVYDNMMVVVLSFNLAMLSLSEVKSSHLNNLRCAAK